ncbi:hypothetical protein KFE98_20090 [bacterium SCSIO 12741]|nr:hypothetical protein KFE98_20090 [bacterium SCSIO 12741]
MQCDPYNVTLTPVGATGADLSFDCNVGAEKNLQFTDRIPGAPEGQIIFEIVGDPTQGNPSVNVTTSFNDRAEGEVDLLILIKEGGQIKGRKQVSYG